MIHTNGTVISKSGAYIINKQQTVDVENKRVSTKTAIVDAKDLDKKIVKDMVENPSNWTYTGEIV